METLLATTLGLWAGLLGKTAPAIKGNLLTRSLSLVLAGTILISAAASMTHNCALRPPPAGICAYTPAFWLAYPTAGGIEL